MPPLEAGLVAIVAGVIAIVLVLSRRPALTEARGGKVLAFLAFFVLPVLVTWAGTSAHLEQSKSTSFCLSCHVMEPYGKSLRIDDPSYLPAVHYQRNLMRRDEACYTCHTSYTMFGDLSAKLNGMKHVAVYYSGRTPERIELYQPYHNRECLYCHDGSRTFEELEDHRELSSELASNETSCLECHVDVHDVHDLEGKSLWTEAEPSP